MSISAILNQSVGGYSLGNILTAAITLLVCLTIVRYAIKIINRLLEVTTLDFRVRRLISNGLKMIMYVITAIIVAQGLGVNMTSFVALLSVVSLGVAMASEDLLGNFAGGLVILAAHPFKPGDIIESSGNFGTVENIYHITDAKSFLTSYISLFMLIKFKSKSFFSNTLLSFFKFSLSNTNLFISSFNLFLSFLYWPFI